MEYLIWSNLQSRVVVAI